MQGRSIAFNEKYQHLAVSNNNGDVTILDYKDFSKRLAFLRDPMEWNEVMAYSPDQEYLAVGSHDDKVYIYTTKDYKLQGVISGPSSAILCLDWTRDSKSIRFVDQSYAKHYSNIDECKLDPHGQDNIGEHPEVWASSSCKISSLESGVYRSGMDGSDINYLEANKTRELLVSADDRSCVSLYRWPAMTN